MCQRFRLPNSIAPGRCNRSAALNRKRICTQTLSKKEIKFKCIKSQKINYLTNHTVFHEPLISYHHRNSTEVLAIASHSSWLAYSCVRPTVEQHVPDL